jgi:hypothetical protein
MNIKTSNWQSVTIITAAILTSMPRWIIALLAAEGITVPLEWLGTWQVVSAFLAACMAVVEGFAFAYIFRAWRTQTGRAADTLLYLAIGAAVAFVLTLSPSMAASVRGITMSEFVANDIVLLLWTTSLALSTILIVISVGYSEKATNVDPKLQEARDEVKRLREEVKHAQEKLNKAQNWEWLYNGSSKKEKIQVAATRWPEMPNRSIAMIVETNESYVSQNKG